MNADIPETEQKRVVVVGGGFAGLKLCRELSVKYQVVLIDKNNYHQFQPLLYQVATAGLEAGIISSPFRKILYKKNNIHIRITKVTAVNTEQNFIVTGIGNISYDWLVLAYGTDNNFYGIKNMGELALPMKSITEALNIRNALFQNYEKAIAIGNKEEQKTLMNVVVVGGGATGVEVSGALAEMRAHFLPGDYPGLDFKSMQISIIEATPKLLNGMSAKASQKAELYLRKMGVNILTNASVKDFDGVNVTLSNGNKLNTKTVIWAAGIIAHQLEGLPNDIYAHGNRLKVDCYNKLEGLKNVFAIGDIAFMSTDTKYPKGHPQVAQVAIQQAKCLACNFNYSLSDRRMLPFRYKNKGSLATVGRNHAVADLPNIKLQGFIAWLLWMFVHLFSIYGMKNRLFTVINWGWSYFTYDRSFSMIIRPINENKT